MLDGYAGRHQVVPGPAARRAEDEGRACAQEHGLTAAEAVAGEYGAPAPGRRPGWQQARRLAQAGTVTIVHVVRWPACIAPENAGTARHRETRRPRDHGVRVRCTWPPLARRTQHRRTAVTGPRPHPSRCLCPVRRGARRWEACGGPGEKHAVTSRPVTGRRPLETGPSP
ncbi:hypothetical protein, partial [Streptomyces albus]|uniref:hypothetical protein n=1 Tax=Streptomyces albus TaxID=1888 RepID=UPI003F1C7102